MLLVMMSEDTLRISKGDLSFSLCDLLDQRDGKIAFEKVSQLIIHRDCIRVSLLEPLA